MWKYRGRDIQSHNDLPDECKAIVYQIEYTDGTAYIGYKLVRSIRRLKPTKEQLAIRKNYRRLELVDLPFVKYSGSSKENKGKTIREKTILHLCSTKRTATALEAKLLWLNNVLDKDSRFNNQNINGKFFDNYLDGLIE